MGAKRHGIGALAVWLGAGIVAGFVANYLIEQRETRLRHDVTLWKQVQDAQKPFQRYADTQPKDILQ